jgi:V/A-type H+-transporting ATPase subunit A
MRTRALQLLERERELREIAALIGVDALQDRERVLLDIARLFREQVLAQSAYDPNDAFSSPGKTHALAFLVLDLHEATVSLLDAGVPVTPAQLGPARRAITRVRDAAVKDLGQIKAEALEVIARFRKELVPA